ncbi:2Fe-2S iron-sulfur cluster-binding protein [Roseateles sp. SL47]|uniref:2Fe-2S iron-sulfur cluster-binding protein n=1 Tax=Roseateles sp. SL47 TaxID=2995138 RepID=UPI00226DC300|nr:2Fe-2S iron-sulfur cluster-binding protein [Roseateles sp. SL47]WAC75569.1 2Fe-2S iron-sulfur cluster-binding protein [Roseateles sp. SL47]
MEEPRFRVTVAPQGWTFDATPGQPLLLAGLAAGVRLPHSCRNGTCRACIAHLQSGEISYRIEWPGLSREEKQEGWILPCVAVAQSDITLAAPTATHMGKAPPPPSLMAPPPGDGASD